MSELKLEFDCHFPTMGANIVIQTVWVDHGSVSFLEHGPAAPVLLIYFTFMLNGAQTPIGAIPTAVHALFELGATTRSPCRAAAAGWRKQSPSSRCDELKRTCNRPLDCQRSPATTIGIPDSSAINSGYVKEHASEISQQKIAQYVQDIRPDWFKDLLALGILHQTEGTSSSMAL